MELPRILVGTSPFIGAGQFGERSLLYCRLFYEKPKAVASIVEEATKLGVNAVQLLPYRFLAEALHIVQHKTSMKLEVVATLEKLEDVELLEGLEVLAYVAHASLVDSRRPELLAELEEAAKERDLLFGVASHSPLTSASWLEGVDLRIDLAMFPLNKLGFCMDGDGEEVARAARRIADFLLAKKVLAAGALRPEEALAYASSLADGVVLGVASREEVRETFSIARQHF